MVKPDNQKPASVQESVYTALRRSIINLNLKPGASISEKDIALHYGVSRTPVREAFIHLSQEGLIKVVPQRETTVSLIDPRRIEQEFFLRENLEKAVLRPFTEKSGPEDFARLEHLLVQQEEALAAEDHIRFINEDDAFHRVFFETAGQELAWNVLESLCGHYHRVRLLTTEFQNIAKNIITQHAQIMKLLARNKPGEAREILSAHLHKLSAEESLLRKEFPQYFASNSGEDAFDLDFAESP